VQHTLWIHIHSIHLGNIHRGNWPADDVGNANREYNVHEMMEDVAVHGSNDYRTCLAIQSWIDLGIGYFYQSERIWNDCVEMNIQGNDDPEIGIALDAFQVNRNNCGGPGDIVGNCSGIDFADYVLV
jgi:hypothetical protein